MAKINAKEVGLITLQGVGVVVLTPFVAGFMGGIDFLSTEIIPGILSIGTTVAAGISAFVTGFVIDKWLK
jgi:uncharacterized membrane protein (DUF485 family)